MSILFPQQQKWIVHTAASHSAALSPQETTVLVCLLQVIQLSIVLHTADVLAAHRAMIYAKTFFPRRNSELDVFK